jgi:hypothetical protein
LISLISCRPEHLDALVLEGLDGIGLQSIVPLEGGVQDDDAVRLGGGDGLDQRGINRVSEADQEARISDLIDVSAGDRDCRDGGIEGEAGL